MSEAPVTPRWRILLTPRWLSWHLFALVAVAGMIWLGDWQLRRALSGNTLSWAYTFEWPIFAIFGVVFWVKTIKDELHPPPQDGSQATQVMLPGGRDTAGPGELDVEASGQAGGNGQAGRAPGSDDPADQELAEYNAYLARLSNEVKGHGRWHGLR